jgi:uncharacterized membrane protein
MKRALIIAFVVNLVVILLSYVLLPERVATHFGLGGAPDSWASKEFNLLLILVIEIPLFLALVYAPTLTLKVPAKLVNLPHRDYWLRPENRALTQAKVARHAHLFGTALYTFLTCVSVLVLHANLSQPVHLDEQAFLLLFGVFLAFVIYWCIEFIRAFRLPANAATRPVQGSNETIA